MAAWSSFWMRPFIRAKPTAFWKAMKLIKAKGVTNG
jgi:hypothetical protein